MSTDFAFSDFLRHPNDVVSALENGDVVLKRRGAPNLRLVVDDRADKTFEAVRILGRIFGSALRDEAVAEAVVEALCEEFAWMDLLPSDDRVACARELLRSARASGEVGELAPFAQCVAEWRNTASIHADPALVEALTRPLVGEGSEVTRPVR